MSRVRRWAGVCEELSTEHAHVIMWETPTGDVEVWAIPLERLLVKPRHGDIVRVRICPRRIRMTVLDRMGGRRT